MVPRETEMLGFIGKLGEYSDNEQITATNPKEKCFPLHKGVH